MGLLNTVNINTSVGLHTFELHGYSSEDIRRAISSDDANERRVDLRRIFAVFLGELRDNWGDKRFNEFEESAFRVNAPKSGPKSFHNLYRQAHWTALLLTLAPHLFAKTTVRFGYTVEESLHYMVGHSSTAPNLGIDHGDMEYILENLPTIRDWSNHAAIQFPQPSSVQWGSTIKTTQTTQQLNGATHMSNIMNKISNLTEIGDVINLALAIAIEKSIGTGAMMDSGKFLVEIEAALEFVKNNGQHEKAVKMAQGAINLRRWKNELMTGKQTLDTLSSDGISSAVKEILDMMYPLGHPTSSAVSGAPPVVTAPVQQGGAAAGLISIDANLKPAIDQLLKSATGGKGLDHLEALVKDANQRVIDMLDEVSSRDRKLADLDQEITTLRAKVLNTTSYQPAIIAQSTMNPSGKVVTKKANELFELDDPVAMKYLSKMEVPVHEWDAPHYRVPVIDSDYQFTIETLLPTLTGLIHNNPTYLTGHTGTGKTTLIEQIAARLGWPVFRLNMNDGFRYSHIVGKDKLTTDPLSGATISQFDPGVLVTAMENGWIFLTDEADGMTADLQLVFFAVLEGRPLALPEGGGKVIHPHPMFRFMASANTAMAGDESKVYHGTNQGNLAFRDRFTGGFVVVDYLPEDLETKLVSKRVPSLKKNIVEKIVKLGREIRLAFVAGDIMETCSPRHMIAMGVAVCRYMGLGMDGNESLKLAITQNLLNKCSSIDRRAIQEIMQRMGTN
jgi:cobaltochelatase CobS